MSEKQPLKGYRNRIAWITRTGVLIALLITLQWLTAGTQAFAGQYITGTCVNCVLAIATLLAGLPSGVCVALFSPFFAFMLKIGPAIPQVVPCIAAGNLVFVLLLYFLSKRGNAPLWQKYIALTVAAIVKAAVLYLTVTKLFIPLMGERLAAKQVVMFTTMFSWPQMVTAFLGGSIAILIQPIIKKGILKRR